MAKGYFADIPKMKKRPLRSGGPQISSFAVRCSNHGAIIGREAVLSWEHQRDVRRPSQGALVREDRNDAEAANAPIRDSHTKILKVVAWRHFRTQTLG
jgi:hypothetical protein